MIIKVLFLKLIPGAYNKSRFGVIYIVTFRGTRMRIEKMKKKKRKSIEAITGQVPFLSSNSAKHQIKELIYIQYRTRVPNIQIISREKKEKKKVDIPPGDIWQSSVGHTCCSARAALTTPPVSSHFRPRLEILRRPFHGILAGVPRRDTWMKCFWR